MNTSGESPTRHLDARVDAVPETIPFTSTSSPEAMAQAVRNTRPAVAGIHTARNQKIGVPAPSRGHSTLEFITKLATEGASGPQVIQEACHILLNRFQALGVWLVDPDASDANRPILLASANRDDFLGDCKASEGPDLQAILAESIRMSAMAHEINYTALNRTFSVSGHDFLVVACPVLSQGRSAGCLTLFFSIGDDLSSSDLDELLLCARILGLLISPNGTQALDASNTAWEHRFMSLASVLPGASVILTDKGEVSRVTPGLELVPGLDSLHKGIGNLDKDPDIPATGDQTKRQGEAFKLAMSGQVSKCHVNHQSTTGSGMRVIEHRFAPIPGKNGEPREVALFARDVTDLVTLKQSLRDLTERDSVTGSMTMASLIDYARLHIDSVDLRPRNNRKTQQTVFMSIEVDGSATGVHLLGNEAFEELLQGIYNRILKSLPGASAIARRGERNFVAVIDVDDAKKFATEASMQLVKELREPLVTGRKEHAMSVTVGYAIFPEDGENADEMFRHADIAASNAQRSGRNAALQFRQEMAQDASDRAQLEARLYKAVENEEFTLAFQPKIQLSDGNVVGAEALLRWNGKNSISPAQFIPIAEECGLILYIGEWVLRQACKTAKRWADAGIRIPISVNVSTRQFSDNNFHVIVGEILSETGCPAELIDLEVTEGVMFIDPVAAIASCARLKEMGLSISIDDFGMGFSSLSYLKSLPADCVKIDRTFIIGVPGDTDNAAIAKAIIAMAKAMEMAVVAEGVEESSELNYLKELGCDQVQGYLFSKPLFEKEFMTWLDAYKLSMALPVGS